MLIAEEAAPRVRELVLEDRLDASGSAINEWTPTLTLDGEGKLGQVLCAEVSADNTTDDLRFEARQLSGCGEVVVVGDVGAVAGLTRRKKSAVPMVEMRVLGGGEGAADWTWLRGAKHEPSRRCDRRHVRAVPGGGATQMTPDGSAAASLGVQTP